MTPMKLPPRDSLQSLLRYDPESGDLFWLARGEASWDARFAGKPALIAKHSSGYCSGALHGKNVYAHRVIWKMVHDEEPPAIDHLDGDRQNNTLRNLRATSHRLNMRNRGRHSTNRSGVTGVYWNQVTSKWFAQFRSAGASVSKSFESLEDAQAWRVQMAMPHGYTKRHCG